MSRALANFNRRAQANTIETYWFLKIIEKKLKPDLTIVIIFNAKTNIKIKLILNIFCIEIFGHLELFLIKDRSLLAFIIFNILQYEIQYHKIQYLRWIYFNIGVRHLQF